MKKKYVLINQEEKEYIRHFLLQYLADVHRIELANTGRTTNFSCPIHNDDKPSAKYYEDSNKFYCFSCAKDYDIYDLFAYDNDLNIKEDFISIHNSLKKIYCDGVSFKDMKTQVKPKVKTNKKRTVLQENFTHYFNKCHADIDKTDYLQKRGIGKNIIDKYNIGFDVKKNNIIMPLSKNHYVARSTKGYFYQTLPYQGLFNDHWLDIRNNVSSLIVCESVIDALSLEQLVNDENINIKVMALNSTSNCKLFISRVKLLLYSGCIILALDNDNAGRTATNYIKTQINELRPIKMIDESNPKDFLLVKELHYTDIEGEDINDVFLNNKEHLLKQIKKELEMIKND